MKKCTITANEFLFQNVETIGKYKNVTKKLHSKKFTSPANECTWMLIMYMNVHYLHKCTNNKKMQICKKKIKFEKNIYKST